MIYTHAQICTWPRPRGLPQPVSGVPVFGKTTNVLGPGGLGYKGMGRNIRNEPKAIWSYLSRAWDTSWSADLSVELR